ncbi:lipopolysaccharide biosynthesis protein [Capnocytophaga stomatis]|uniref:lipopolysaccharide biosynthesis protein n=1 Tax=Capnocytophaga stomatis TaxID=1848904 RepID=UPI00385F29CA
MSIISQSIKASSINYVGILLGAFFTLYLTPEFLTAEYNGLYRVLLEYAAIIASYAHFGIPLIINKYYHIVVNNKDKTDKGFDFFVFILPLIFFAFIGLLFLIFREYITKLIVSESDYHLVYQYVLFMIPIFLCNGYLLIQKNYAAMLGNISFVTFIQNIVFKLFNILAVVIFIFTKNFKWSMWLIVFSNIVGVFAVYLKILSLKKGHICLVPSFDFITKNKLTRDFLLFLSFIILSNLTTFFITRIDLFFVAKYTDLSNVAFYTTASFFVLFLMVPYNSVLAISFPEIAKEYIEGNFKELEKLIKENAMFGFILSIFCFLIIWLNIDFIYQIIPNGEIYSKGKYVFLILAIGKLIDISIGSVGQLIVTSRWYYYTLLFSILNSIIGIVLGYYLTIKYGILGSALAISVTTLISDIFQVTLIWVKFKILPYENRNVLKILLITAIVVIFSYIIESFIVNKFVTFILKVFIVSSIMFGGIYLFKINEQINKLTSHLLVKIKLK